jgi:hypothetical protein
MNLVKKIINGLKSKIRGRSKLKHAKLNPKYDKFFSFSEAIKFYKNRNDIYMYFHHCYNHGLPKPLQEHREYIEKNEKGFGEPAFHTMWWKLIIEFKPKNCLEIGVYRGQVISLWTLISKLEKQDMRVSGISPFSSLSDSVSEYMNTIDFYQDVQETFEELDLKKPSFVRGLSSDDKAIEYIKSRVWDMVYIDGGHDYEDVLSDYKLCLENIKKGGLIIFDDASLYTDYQPLPFSFAGHPGPSLVAREYADKEMRFVGAVGHNNVYMKK